MNDLSGISIYHKRKIKTCFHQREKRRLPVDKPNEYIYENKHKNFKIKT